MWNPFKRTDEQKAADEQARQDRATRRAAATARYHERIAAADSRWEQDKALIEEARTGNTATFKAAIDANTRRYREKIAAADESRDVH